jgi:vanillate O-demethylase ferredoxin subunit
MTLKVLKRTDLCADIMALDLVSPDGRELPSFEAGAHIDVTVNDQITRQYSICSDPSERNIYRLGVLKDPSSRGGSAGLHGTISDGDELVVSVPRNLFPLDESADFSLLVGGGIGITPMIAMAHKLHAAGRGFRLHYCVTDPDKAAFLSELKASPFSDKVHIHFDQSSEAKAFEPATDMPEAQATTHIYTCGPTGFMDWILGAAKTKGYASSQLHKEDFGVDVDLSGSAFTVEASRSGKTIEITDGQSIADGLIAAGIDVALSCEEGICGTCLTDVLEGEIDHRDLYLSDEEKEDGDVILVCCSRAKSRKLVLDI